MGEENAPLTFHVNHAVAVAWADGVVVDLREIVGQVDGMGNVRRPEEEEIRVAPIECRLVMTVTGAFALWYSLMASFGDQILAQRQEQLDKMRETMRAIGLAMPKETSPPPQN